MVFTMCPNHNIMFFLVLLRLCNTPPSFKRYVMEPNVFLRYPTKGITCVLSNFGHEQYTSNNINPWCLIT